MIAAGFMEQFCQAWDNALQLVLQAGGQPQHISQITLSVVDRQEYALHQHEVGQYYRRFMGRHYPRQTLLEMPHLKAAQAQVAVELTALIP